MYSLLASRMGEAAKELCGACAAGQVHSVFAKNVNLTMVTGDAVSAPSDVLTISLSGFALHPAAIIAAPQAIWGFKDMGISQGDPVSISGGILAIGRRVTIHGLQNAAIWQPSLLQAPAHKGSAFDDHIRTEIEQKANYILDKLTHIRASAGFYPLIPYFGDMMAGQGRAPGSAMRTMAYDAIVGLVKAFRQRDKAGAIHAAGRLIGLGEGLTPSGDDFVAGFAAARFGLQKAFCLGDEEVEMIRTCIMSHKNNTVGISRHFLLYASTGLFGELTENFLHSMLCDKEFEAYGRAKELLRYGASSGLDHMLGILCGLLV